MAKSGIVWARGSPGGVTAAALLSRGTAFPRASIASAGGAACTGAVLHTRIIVPMQGWL